MLTLATASLLAQVAGNGLVGHCHPLLQRRPCPSGTRAQLVSSVSIGYSSGMWKPEDTTAEAWRRQHELWHEMGPSGRLRACFDASIATRRLTMAGIRRRHPHYTDQQVRWALDRMLLGDDLFRAAFPHAQVLEA